MNTQTLFAILGLLFLTMAGWSTMRAGKLVPQAKTWLLISIIFSTVALWLWLGPGHP